MGKGGKGKVKRREGGREGQMEAKVEWSFLELVHVVGNGDRGGRRRGREGGREGGRTRHLPVFLAAGFLETFFGAAALGWWK